MMMHEAIFKFHIEGTGSENTAKELSQLIEQELGQKPIAISRGQQRDNDPERKDVVGITAVAAAVLAVPAALLAAFDLVERMKKKPKVDLLIKWAHQEREKNPEINIRIVTPKGLAVQLHLADSTEVLNAASEVLEAQK